MNDQKNIKKTQNDKPESFLELINGAKDKFGPYSKDIKDMKIEVDGKEVELEDRHFFILMLLVNDGTITMDEIKERFVVFVSQFGSPKRMMKYQQRKGRKVRRGHKGMNEAFYLEAGYEELTAAGYITSSKDGNISLTPRGEKIANKISNQIKEGGYYSRKILKYLLRPSTVTRVTVLIDLVLAVMKLSGGILTGSRALIADGADAAADTFSAFLVWLGLKIKKETLATAVIIIMMFITAFSISYETIGGIVDLVYGRLEPIENPVLAIGVESVALVSAVALYFYQHYSGKRFGRIALISQSVDSKNHILVAGVIIVGAIFSIFGVHFVDTLISGFIAIRILLDAIELTKETLAHSRGEEIDFSKYKTIVDGQLDSHRQKSFKDWILYSLRDCHDGKTKEELIKVLEETYNPKYIPIVSEFGFGIGRGYDFDKNFGGLVGSLMDEGLLEKSGSMYLLTKKGISSVNHMVGLLRGGRF